jgi:hypothetical protein
VIDESVLSVVRPKFQALLYLYLALNIKRSRFCHEYSCQLIAYLKNINEDNLQYNKIMAMVLTGKLPDCYSLNAKLNCRSILSNILNWSISGTFLEEWANLFIMIFSYCPFKSDITRCYIQNFGYIVDGSDLSVSCASSISCQLINNYKLIENYCDL